MIGRAPTCTIIIENPTVSCNHATLEYDKKNDIFWLEDLGSSNKTRMLLRGKKTEIILDKGKVVQVGHGCRITFGNQPTLLIVSSEEEREKRQMQIKGHREFVLERQRIELEEMQRTSAACSSETQVYLEPSEAHAKHAGSKSIAFSLESTQLYSEPMSDARSMAAPPARSLKFQGPLKSNLAAESSPQKLKSREQESDDDILNLLLARNNSFKEHAASSKKTSLLDESLGFEEIFVQKQLLSNPKKTDFDPTQIYDEEGAENQIEERNEKLKNASSPPPSPPKKTYFDPTQIYDEEGAENQIEEETNEKLKNASSPPPPPKKIDFDPTQPIEYEEKEGESKNDQEEQKTPANSKTVHQTLNLKLEDTPSIVNVSFSSYLNPSSNPPASIRLNFDAEQAGSLQNHAKEEKADESDSTPSDLGPEEIEKTIEHLNDEIRTESTDIEQPYERMKDIQEEGEADAELPPRASVPEAPGAPKKEEEKPALDRSNTIQDTQLSEISASPTSADLQHQAFSDIRQERLALSTVPETQRPQQQIENTSRSLDNDPTIHATRTSKREMRKNEPAFKEGTLEKKKPARAAGSKPQKKRSRDQSSSQESSQSQQLDEDQQEESGKRPRTKKTLDSSLPSAIDSNNSPKKSKSRSHRIMFTGILPSESIKKAIRNLKGSIVDAVSEATHLITDKVHRTGKFLCAVSTIPFVLSISWITQSEKAKYFLGELV